MKLYWSSRSPYVRKVMIVAHEKNLVSQIEPVPITVGQQIVSAEFHAINPIGRIPTLILEDGTIIYDSTVIAEYLDLLSPENPLMPTVSRDRLTVRCLHALGTGIMDVLIPLRGEVLRPQSERSIAFIEATEAKFQHTIDRLEIMMDVIESDSVDLGQIAIATALSYSDFRFPKLAWRSEHPHLTTWFDTICRRPAFCATAFV